MPSSLLPEDQWTHFNDALPAAKKGLWDSDDESDSFAFGPPAPPPPSIPKFGRDRRGRVLIFPHGVEVKYLPLHQGIRCVAQTSVLFEKFDPATPNPYMWTEDKTQVKYQKMYTHVPITPATNPTPGAPRKTYLEELYNQVEAHRKIFACPANGINEETFPIDAWSIILCHVNLLEVSALMASSQTLHKVIKESDYWRALLCQNYPQEEFQQNFGILPYLDNWYQRYQRLTFAFSPKNYSGTVIDMGSAFCKYAGYDRVEGILNFESVPATFSITTQKHHDDDDIFGPPTSRKKYTLGIGDPFVRTDLTAFEQICSNLVTSLDSRICIIVGPNELPPSFPKLGFTRASRVELRWCEASTATLCGYNKKSGVVLSLGNSSCWIEYIFDYKSKWNFVSKTVHPTVQDEIEELVQAFLATWVSDSFMNPEHEPLREFYCIGGRFDAEAVQILTKVLSSTGFKFQVCSKPENRIFSPVVGALLSFDRNQNFVHQSNAHLLYGNPNFVPPPTGGLFAGDDIFEDLVVALARRRPVRPRESDDEWSD